MRPHSQPRPPTELQILENLNLRMKLTKDDQLNYQNLEKGYIGERKFARLLDKNLTNSPILLYDLRFKVNNTEFQIDCLPIFSNKIYHFEIKNFEGDFYYDNDNWYIVQTKKEIRSPLQQLKRCQILLKELLHKLGYNVQVESYIIFVNEEFTLYKAPINSQIILPTQVNRFIRRLNEQTAKINKYHTKLADQLVNLHIQDSSHKNIPTYEYDDLKKGITCKNCSSFLYLLKNNKFECQVCHHKENIRSSIFRCILEFNLLFPYKRITTNTIYQWCDGRASKRVIRNTLQENLISVGKGKSTHYILKK